MRNPSWKRDELILALDLYFREPSARGSKTHPEVIALSDLLNRLPIHGDNNLETFRNPNGVGMKLSNFLRYDPSYTGKGLERGSKLEEEVWDQFSGNLQHLREVASAIRTNYKDIDLVVDEIDEEEAEEGRVLTKVHRQRERSASIVAKKKAKVLKETGSLVCEVCGFNFAATYGALGEGFAECHHEKPVSEIKSGEKTKLSDLRIVCPNCHRMIHRRRPWLTVDQLKGLLQR